MSSETSTPSSTEDAEPPTEPPTGASTGIGAPGGGPASEAPAPGSPGPAEPDAGASGPTPPAAPVRNRFFTWLREIDLPRRPGWIGGVCAGVAERLGIDPLIVRGVALVVAVLGGPAVLLYAVAWFLLPDQDDRTHAEDMVTGRLTGATAGIGALVVLSFLPLAQGFWYLGGAYWGEMLWAPGFGRGIWTLVLVGLLTWWLIWIARRSSRATTTGAPTRVGQGGAPTAQYRETDGGPLPDHSTGIGPAPSPLDPPPPAAPPATASTAHSPAYLPPAPARPSSGSAEDLAAWRYQQAAWTSERDAFRAQAQAGAREMAQRRSAEARARSAAATAERIARRQEWLRANPRAGGAYSAIALGTATVVGGIVTTTASGTAAVALGLAAGLLVLGLAIVIAGARRRRSGFLSFVAVATMIATLAVAALPIDRTTIGGVSYGVSNATPGRYAMPVGALQVTVDPDIGDPGTVVDVWQGAGTVRVAAVRGATVRVEIVSPSGQITREIPDATVGTRTEYVEDAVYRDGAWRWSGTVGPAGPADTTVPDAIVRIEQATVTSAVTLWSESSSADGTEAR